MNEPTPYTELLDAVTLYSEATVHYEQIVEAHEAAHRFCQELDQALFEAMRTRDQAADRLLELAMNPDFNDQSAADALHVPVIPEPVDPRMVRFGGEGKEPLKGGVW